MSDRADVRGINSRSEAFWAFVLAIWIIVGILVALPIVQLSAELYLRGVQLIIGGMILHVALASLRPKRRKAA